MLEKIIARAILTTDGKLILVVTDRILSALKEAGCVVVAEADLEDLAVRIAGSSAIFMERAGDPVWNYDHVRAGSILAGYSAEVSALTAAQGDGTDG